MTGPPAVRRRRVTTRGKASKRAIGVVLAGASARVGVEPFFMELIAGVEQELAPTGTTVLLLVVPGLADELATYRRWARDRVVDAVIVVNLTRDDVRPAEVARLGLPAVLAGQHSAEVPLSRVVTDSPGAMTAAMELLASLGHRVVGRVSGPAELVHTVARSVAMRAAGERLGVAVHIVEGDYSADAGVRGARSLVTARPHPTAILFDNDLMAVAAEEYLVRSGVAIPGELSLLAYDDSPLCETAAPTLSVLSIDVHEHGALLGRAVIEVLAGEPARVYPGPPVRVLQRGSTGPARAGAAPGPI